MYIYVYIYVRKYFDLIFLSGYIDFIIWIKLLFIFIRFFLVIINREEN